MNLYSLYTLHDRSRQSTKTCAECHTYSLVGYGGGILDDIFQSLHLYWGAERRNIESKGLFRWYKGSYELLGTEQDIPCDLISVVSCYLFEFSPVILPLVFDRISLSFDNLSLDVLCIYCNLVTSYCFICARKFVFFSLAQVDFLCC